MNPFVNVSQVLLALLAIIALIAALGYAARHVQRLQGVKGGTSAGGGLSVVETLYLGNKERIVLLRHGERQILVGITGQGMVRLSETQAADAELHGQLEAGGLEL